MFQESFHNQMMLKSHVSLILQISRDHHSKLSFSTKGIVVIVQLRAAAASGFPKAVKFSNNCIFKWVHFQNWAFPFVFLCFLF